MFRMASVLPALSSSLRFNNMDTSVKMKFAEIKPLTKQDDECSSRRPAEDGLLNSTRVSP
jgi:hypothetical protein